MSDYKCCQSMPTRVWLASWAWPISSVMLCCCHSFWIFRNRSWHKCKGFPRLERDTCHSHAVYPFLTSQPSCARQGAWNQFQILPFPLRSWGPPCRALTLQGCGMNCHRGPMPNLGYSSPGSHICLSSFILSGQRRLASSAVWL